MRTLFHAGALGMLGAAVLHCSADGLGVGDALDAGDIPPVDASPSGDAEASTPEDGADAHVADAGGCSDDGWCRTELPGDDLELTAVWSFAADDALLASTSQLLHWNGTALTPVDAPEAEGLTSLWATSTNDVWGVAQYNHRLVHGTRAAAGQPFTWSKVEYDSKTSPTLDVIRGTGTNELWVYGTLLDEHLLQHGVITGATVAWTTIPIVLATFRGLNSFCVTEGGEIWIAGRVAVGWSNAGGVVRGSPVQGEPDRYEWSQALTGPSGDNVGLTTIWSESADLWTIGNSGKSFRGALTSDGGVDWSPVPSNTNTTMRSIWGRGPNDLWLVGEAGAIRHWDGTKWSVSRLAVGGLPMWQDLAAVHAGSAGDIWAVGSRVALHRASLGGSP